LIPIALTLKNIIFRYIAFWHTIRFISKCRLM